MSEKFPFDIVFEKKLLHLLQNDSNLLIKASKYLKKEYFSTEVLQWIYFLYIDYYSRYNKSVSSEVLYAELLELQKRKPEVRLLEYVEVLKDIRDIKVTEKEYIIEKVEEFIKRNMFVRGFKKMKDEYNASQFDDSIETMHDTFDKINQVKFNETHRSFFFEEAGERAFKRNDKIQSGIERFSTGILELDAKTEGGLGRGELGVVLADAGVGKSICVINSGASVVRSFGKVVHFTLEGKRGQVADRYESRLLNYEYNKIKRNELPPEFNKHYEMYNNSLVIIEMLDRWDYTVLDIEAELKHLASIDFVPDMIIVDYGDLLSPRNLSKENTYLSQEQTYRDLKTLANKYNAAVWSPTQANRAEKGTDPKNNINFWYTRYNQADCYAKVRICDLFITLNRTDQEARENQMRVYLDKFRDDECGIKLNIKTNYRTMNFYVPQDSSWLKLNQAQGLTS